MLNYLLCSVKVSHLRKHTFWHPWTSKSSIKYQPKVRPSKILLEEQSLLKVETQKGTQLDYCFARKRLFGPPCACIVVTHWYLRDPFFMFFFRSKFQTEKIRLWSQLGANLVPKWPQKVSLGGPGRHR